MFLEGKAGSTIVSMSSALAYVHKLAVYNMYKNPCDTYSIKKLIISIQKKTPSVDLRCPINSLILNKLVAALPSVCQFYDAVMFKALFLALFHGCFRVGELVAHSQSAAHLVVQMADITFSFRSGCLSKAVLILQHAKNKKRSHLAEQVTLGPKMELCPPPSAIITFIKLRGSTLGPLFAYPGGQSLVRAKFAKELALVLQQVGLDPARYKGYSFRIGAATEAAACGKSDSDIRLLGRGQSDAFKKYVRLHYLQ